MARPRILTQELADAICQGLMAGKSLREVCESEEMPDKATVLVWILKEEYRWFYDQYTIARQVQAELMADEIFLIADDGTNDWMKRNDPDNEGYILNGEHYQRSRVRIDTRKWYLSKVLPKIYGDKVTVDAKVDHEHKHKHTIANVPETINFLESLTADGSESALPKPSTH